MNKELGNKDWKTFSNWERTYKKKALKALTIDAAFAIFSDLWNAQAGFPAKEIELFRKRKLDAPYISCQNIEKTSVLRSL
ncbi:MAG: hypothetical protein PHU34_06885 [Candidatus Methanoperedens sp.]|nr:hypothetical protein [Candidatus Methanoperedens sp.]